MKIMLGCDPEFFLKKDGINISSHGLVPGNKLEPFPLKYGAVQLDGTATEFNTYPARDSKEFTENVLGVLGELRTMIPEEYKFDFSPSVIYETAVWEGIPPTCKELGCNPDFNAWASRINSVPKLPAHLQYMRTGAGHLHVGWGSGIDMSASHIWDCERVVKSLDTYFSFFKNRWDTDKRRSTLYGARGAYRPKPYGVEYRVLSNAWLKYPLLYPWLFDSVQWVMNTLESSEGNWDNFFDEDRMVRNLGPYPKFPDNFASVTYG